MTLEQLANDISASADAEAKATIKAAKAEAEAILNEAKELSENPTTKLCFCWFLSVRRFA